MFMQEEVAKGIEYLDSYDPGWREAIDWDSLDMGHHEKCIGGQLMGSYFNLANRIYKRDSDEIPADYGFNIHVPVGNRLKGFFDQAVIDYRQLTETWKTMGGN